METYCSARPRLRLLTLSEVLCIFSVFCVAAAINSPAQVLTTLASFKSRRWLSRRYRLALVVSV